MNFPTYRFLIVGSLCLICSSLSLLCPVVEAQGNGVIEGYVRDRMGKPIANLTVVLKGAGGMQVDRASTDNEGHYIFSQIGAGNFFVSVEPAGAPPESKLVQILAEESYPHRREDFSLDSSLPNPSGIPPGEPAFQQQVPPEAEQVYQQGIEHLKAGRRDEALAAFELAVAKFPNYFNGLAQVAMEYLRRGNVPKAGAACQRALAVNKNSASAHFGLGWAYYQAEKLDDAARELNESAKLNPQAGETFWFLGMSEMERKQWRAAEQAFATFRKLHARDDRPILHMYLTSVYDSLGRPADAVRSLEMYLKAIPEKDRTQKLKELLVQLKRKRDG